MVAIFRGVSAFETGGALMPLDQLQKVSDMGRNVTAFHVRLRPARSGESEEARIQQVRTKIQTMLPGVKAVAAAEMARNNQVLVLARSMAWGTSFIALLVSALGIANTMAMSVFERTKEIGILRALGWKCWRVMRMILVESAVLGLVGGAIGIVLGWGVHCDSWPPCASRPTSRSRPSRYYIQCKRWPSPCSLDCWRAWYRPIAVPACSPVEALRHD